MRLRKRTKFFPMTKNVLFMISMVLQVLTVWIKAAEGRSIRTRSTISAICSAVWAAAVSEIFSITCSAAAVQEVPAENEAVLQRVQAFAMI